MLLKIWSLLASTSIALQSISILFPTLLFPFPRRWLWCPPTWAGMGDHGGEHRGGSFAAG